MVERRLINKFSYFNLEFGWAWYEKDEVENCQCNVTNGGKIFKKHKDIFMKNSFKFWTGVL